MNTPPGDTAARDLAVVGAGGPAPGVATADTGAGWVPAASLSPSRASDFMSCPLKYRFRVVDRLPEAPSAAATRGTVVHAVLEALFDRPRDERTLDHAVEGLVPAWEALLEEEPEQAELFADDPEGLGPWLESARELLATYFRLEDPRLLDPAARELQVEHVLESGLTLRGIIDRLDEAADGALRVVDYKTGRAPNPDFEASALFQMKFYALVLWRGRGVVPRELKLLYLNGGESLTYSPDERELEGLERRLGALWAAIERAHETGDWRPRPSKLCDWCDHKALCPAWGGTPPPLPSAPAELSLG